MRRAAFLPSLLAFLLLVLAGTPAYVWSWWALRFVATDLLPVTVLIGLFGALAGVLAGRTRWAALGLLSAVVGALWLAPLAQTLANDRVHISALRWLGRTADPAVPFRADVPIGHDLLVDVYGEAGDAPKPCVIVVHGGSWVHGDKGDGAWASRALVRAGAIVLDLRYRLAPQHPFPAGLHDVLYALAAARAGVVPGVDPTRVVLLGRSAGGHLALLAAVGASRADLAPPDLGPQAPPAAVVALYPPVDLAWSWNHIMDPDLTDTRSTLADFLGGSLDEVPAVYNQASPNMVAGPDAPPALVLFGQAEQVVSPQQAKFVADAWRAQGRVAELGVLPLFDHGLDTRRGSIGGQWVEARTLRFLRANGMLPRGSGPGDVADDERL